jgi:hypothetical protein
MSTIGLECLECRSLDAIALGPVPIGIDILGGIASLLRLSYCKRVLNCFMFRALR